VHGALVNKNEISSVASRLICAFLAVLATTVAVGTGAAVAQESSKASPVDGIWLGTLQLGGQSLRIQVLLTSDAQGQEHCSMDSIDQGAFNVACTNVTYADRKLNFDIPAVKGQWSGELSADQNALNGNWKQGAPQLSISTDSPSAGHRHPNLSTPRDTPSTLRTCSRS